MLETLLAALLASTTESCADGGSPRIVIGAWQLLERHRDESMAVETVKAYMAAGFEHFDTADIYGKSESLLGRAGAKHIYTKYVTSDASEANARAVNAQSRTALGVVPSLVQFHCMAMAAAGRTPHRPGKCGPHATPHALHSPRFTPSRQGGTGPIAPTGRPLAIYSPSRAKGSSVRRPHATSTRRTCASSWWTRACRSRRTRSSARHGSHLRAAECLRVPPSATACH